MAVTVAVVGCLDTKGEELGFLVRVLEEAGVKAHVVDTGILKSGGAGLSHGGATGLSQSGRRPDTTGDAVAEAAGTSLGALRDKGDRGHAVKCMSQGAAIVVRALFEENRIQGVLSAGGSAGTTIATTAMRALPVGFPKLVVSTLASGNVSPYVGTKDVTMMYSVVDVAGLNRISIPILTNAARAVAAMASGEPPEVSHSKLLVAATMFGVTTPCVTEARKHLEAAGYEVVVFHATGSGGRAMESLMEDGFISAVLDITTTELADELVGGILSAGENRLTTAAALGLPQVVSIGAVDMVNFGPRDTVPENFSGRTFYEHNPTVTLMRTTIEENAAIGQRIAERLSAARGPVEVLLPMRGVSAISTDAGVFHDPAADAACIEAIKSGLDGRIPVREVDTDINDPEFARTCVDTLLRLLAA